MLPDWAARSMESHSLHQKSLAQYLERVLTFLRANCRQAKVSLQGLLLYSLIALISLLQGQAQALPYLLRTSH